MAPSSSLPGNPPPFRGIGPFLLPPNSKQLPLPGARRGRLPEPLPVPWRIAAGGADRIAVLGFTGGCRPDLCDAVRIAGMVRPLAARSRYQDHIRASRHRDLDDFRDPALRRPATGAGDAGTGLWRGGSGADAWCRRLADVHPGDPAEDQVGAALWHPAVQRPFDG